MDDDRSRRARSQQWCSEMSPSTRVASALAVSTLLLMGCATRGAEMLRLPGFLPTVAATESAPFFKLKVVVRNHDEATTSPRLRLNMQVYTQQQPKVSPERLPGRDCRAIVDFAIEPLGPLTEWTLEKRVGDLTPGCGCMRGDCGGSVVLRLYDEAGYLLPGENNYLDVKWERSGDPNTITVEPGKR